jgi:C4-dicarboxylate transporter DctM subunit
MGMEPVSAGIIFTIVMMVFMLLCKIPVGFAMGLAGAMGIYAMGGILPLSNVLSFTPYSMSSSFMLVTLPMFILMGFFVAESGIGIDLFVAVRNWIGWLRGGLAMAVSVACAAMGAVIGSAITTAVTISPIALPEMRRYGYKDSLSAGAIAASGNLGCLIPPSVPLIIYGVMTETSIGHLFIAGIGPGILTMFLFCVIAYIISRIDPKAGPATPRAPLRQAIRLPAGVYIVIVIAIVCLGGIYAGFATPTEAGALGAFITLVFGLATRRLGWSGFRRAFSGALKTTGMIFMLIIGAMIFGGMLAMSGLPFKLVEVLTEMAVQPWVILVMILVIYIILGFFLDIMAILMILMPVLAPVFDAFGFDRVWIGVLTIMTALMGGITPPVGITVYALAGVIRDVPMWSIFKGVMPFFVMMIVALGLIIAFPDIALGIVKLMKPWAY